MTNEVSIRCQKAPEVGIRRIPAYTPQDTPALEGSYFNKWDAPAHTACSFSDINISQSSVATCWGWGWICFIANSSQVQLWKKTWKSVNISTKVWFFFLFTSIAYLALSCRNVSRK